MKAIDRSRELFNKHFLPALEKRYPECLGNFAAGLIGHGSECFGFDDEVSLDHDVSNGFYIWLDDENDVKYGVKLFRVYKEVFEQFGETFGKHSGAVKRGVVTIRSFLEDSIGAGRLPTSDTEWLAIPCYALANLTNGEIFYDGNGVFTRALDSLKKGMPRDARLKRISALSALAAQSGQYNFSRCIAHKQFGAASLAIAEFVQNISELIYLLNGKFMPYYKWSLKGLKKLDILSSMAAPLEFLLCEETSEKTAKLKADIIEDIATAIIEEFKRQDLSSAESNYLEPHAFSIASRIQNEELKNTHIMQK